MELYKKRTTQNMVVNNYQIRYSSCDYISPFYFGSISIPDNSILKGD